MKLPHMTTNKTATAKTRIFAIVYKLDCQLDTFNVTADSYAHAIDAAKAEGKKRLGIAALRAEVKDIVEL